MILQILLVRQIRQNVWIVIAGIQYQVVTAPFKDPLGDIVLNLARASNDAWLTLHVPHYVAMEVYTPLV